MEDALLPVVELHPPTRKLLRIAVVTETYPPEVNGVATTVARFVRGLCERHHEVQLVRPRQGDSDRADDRGRFHEILQRGMAIPRYPDLRMGLPARRALQRLWIASRPDVVHIVTEGPLGWSALQAATQAAAAGDVRLPHQLPRLQQPLRGRLAAQADRRAICASSTTARRSRWCRPMRWRTICRRGASTICAWSRAASTPGLFDPARRDERLRRQWGATADTPVAIYVGRLAPEKNLPALLAAFDAIRRRVPAARLVVVGDGPAAKSLRAQCPDVHFAGIRTGEELAAHYASADVFLFPSLTETFGNVTLEAMASGLAVVAYDYAAAAQHIRHGHERPARRLRRRGRRRRLRAAGSRRRRAPATGTPPWRAGAGDCREPGLGARRRAVRGVADVGRANRPAVRRRGRRACAAGRRR